MMPLITEFFFCDIRLSRRCNKNARFVFLTALFPSEHICLWNLGGVFETVTDVDSPIFDVLLSYRVMLETALVSPRAWPSRDPLSARSQASFCSAGSSPLGGSSGKNRFLGHFFTGG